TTSTSAGPGGGAGTTGGAGGGSGDPDGVPPNVTAAAISSSGDLVIAFSEPVQPPTAVNPADFALSLAVVQYTCFPPYATSASAIPASACDGYNWTVYHPIAALDALSQPGSNLEMVAHPAMSLAGACGSEGLYLHYKQRTTPVQDLDGM